MNSGRTMNDCSIYVLLSAHLLSANSEKFNNQKHSREGLLKFVIALRFAMQNWFLSSFKYRVLPEMTSYRRRFILSTIKSRFFLKSLHLSTLAEQEFLRIENIVNNTKYISKAKFHKNMRTMSAKQIIH